MWFLLLVILLRADEVDNFQKAWDNLKTLKADVRQTSENKALGLEPEVQEGVLYLKKPGYLRFDSKTENTTQILNRKEFILKKNQRNRVDIVALKSGKLPKAFQFFSGKQKFKEIYELKSVTDKGEALAFHFIPKHGKKESYIAEIEKKSYLLKALLVEAGDSKVGLSLANIKPNEKLEDKLFHYQPDAKDIVNRDSLKE